jgi:alanine-glyoxylate transaminase/serine-glyoxylate transaminase/serine-pyruvate transaminase
MEASFVNLVGPGDTVVIGVNGLFGERMCDVAGRAGARVVRVDTAWGQPLDPAQVIAAAASQPTKLIAIVHAETSTGVRNDLGPLADVDARPGGALLLVDCVTSLGGIPFAADGWGVDVAYSGTQKCLGVPPGLAPLTVSARALERIVERPPSWYLDLNLLARYVQDGSAAGRVYHHTAPVSMVAALHAGLGVLLDEGISEVQQRHAACGKELQGGLEALGLELLVEPGHRLPQLTTVRVPAGIDDASCRGRLLTDYGIEIGAGGSVAWATRHGGGTW